MFICFKEREEKKRNTSSACVPRNIFFVTLMQVKKPGLEMSTVQSELDLSYRQRYQGVVIPEAYERLILDTYGSLPLCMLPSFDLFGSCITQPGTYCIDTNYHNLQIAISCLDLQCFLIFYRIRGDQQHFVRRDELKVCSAFSF